MFYQQHLKVMPKICKDLNDYCKDWAARMNENNPSYMLTNCCGSCNNYSLTTTAPPKPTTHHQNQQPHHQNQQPHHQNQQPHH